MTRADEPTPLASNVWHVGHRGHRSYLLRLANDATTEARWVWIDPGSNESFPAIDRRARELMSGYDDLALVVATGLNEGAIQSLPTVLERAPRALLLMNWDTWNFVSVKGLPEARVRLAERFRPGLRLAEVGRTLRVVVNPYGQFTGAFALFEPRSGCLFSGDLLAGDPGPDGELFAVDSDWPRIREWQARLMPCNAAVRWTLGRIRRLAGLAMVCPQSGPLLRGAVLERFLDRLEELPVGADLLPSGSDIVDGPDLVLDPVSSSSDITNPH